MNPETHNVQRTACLTFEVLFYQSFHIHEAQTEKVEKILEEN